ncbi:MAG: glycosyltransferase [Crocinitomicaceae bacterium]|nr:glycosyltransferase [Crocinitomicaceae bacterium]
MKNVLYISYDGMTDSLGQSQVLPYLVGLSKENYKISLISCEKPERFLLFKEQIQAICDHSNIEWHPINYTKRPPLLSTIWDVWQLKRKATQLHKINSFQLVHCRSYIAALVGLQMKKRYQTKFVFDMRGFWADERVDGKIWSLSNPILKSVYNYFKKKERLFFSQSDKIVCLTNNGKQEILSWNLSNVTDQKIVVIPCCVDIDLFNPTTISIEQTQGLKKQLGISSDDFILGYVGSIGTWYMLPEMLDYFNVFQQHKPTAKFLFITNEPPEAIRSQAIEKGINPDNILITSCFHKEMPLYISTFDASIFFIIPSYSKKASSPTKQGEIMSMGIPLICNSNVGDTDKIVLKYKSGIVIDEFTTNCYKSALSIAENYDKSETQRGAKEHFSLETGVKNYTSIYRELIG